MPDEIEIQIYSTLDELQTAVAERVAEILAAAVAARGRALVAISGGSAPPGVFRRLCVEPLLGRVPWGALSVVWADERVVPFDHAESNYRQAREALLDHVPIPSDQIYPVACYLGMERAAEVYDRQVAALLDTHGGRLDLLLLGMGPDGHTASLFPGFPQLDGPAGAMALPVAGSPKPPPERVTLSAAALNCAAEVIFLVAGADKATKVRAALRGPYEPHATPAQIVRPPAGRVTWMLDAAAAAEL